VRGQGDDVVAHAISVIVLQVGAVRHNLPADLAEEQAALRGAEDAGRTALTQMRGLLGALRDADEELERAPQPGLDDLGPLVEDVRRTGLTVNVHVEGDPVPLPAALDLSAYRVVQEGLTNVLKHAQAEPAEVVVRYRPDTLELEVRDDGRGPAASDGAGHGLVGLRERVKIYAGSMDAGPAAGRGFVLRTRFPLTVEARWRSGCWSPTTRRWCARGSGCCCRGSRGSRWSGRRQTVSRPYAS